MIDYDLRDVKYGCDRGWHIVGRDGHIDTRHVPHAVNCKCRQVERDCYERHLAGVTQNHMAQQLGVSHTRIYDHVSRVRRCKVRAIRHAAGAFTGMSERDALCLISYLNGIAEAAQCK